MQEPGIDVPRPETPHQRVGQLTLSRRRLGQLWPKAIWKWASHVKDDLMPIARRVGGADRVHEKNSERPSVELSTLLCGKAWLWLCEATDRTRANPLTDVLLDAGPPYQGADFGKRISGA